MPVGHTHNDVDQYFSVLASKLKKREIPSFENLVDELKKLKMDGVPIVVQEIKSTSDFSSLVLPHLNKLSGHTSFYQFKFIKEKQGDTGEVTKMFVKENSLKEKWMFLDGIKLFKSKPDLTKLKVAPFRDDSSYEDILKSVRNKYFPTLENKFSVGEVNAIKQNWAQRIDLLKNCKSEDFLPFDFKKLKPQTPSCEENTIVENIQRCSSRREAALTATFYPSEMSSFSVEDLQLDVSIVFYTNVKRSRPWVGLFQGLCNTQDGNLEVEVQWLNREKKQFLLALNEDGTSYTSRLEIETIMFSDVLTNISSTGDRGGPYIMDAETVKEIKSAYDERDRTLT